MTIRYVGSFFAYWPQRLLLSAFVVFVAIDAVLNGESLVPFVVVALVFGGLWLWRWWPRIVLPSGGETCWVRVVNRLRTVELDVAETALVIRRRAFFGLDQWARVHFESGDVSVRSAVRFFGPRALGEIDRLVEAWERCGGRVEGAADG